MLCIYRRHVQYSKDVFFSYTNAVSLGAKIIKKNTVARYGMVWLLYSNSVDCLEKMWIVDNFFFCKECFKVWIKYYFIK